MTKNQERKVPDKRDALYHWAPRNRRSGILRYGLRPGMWSLDHDWKPPHFCMSDDPWLAWNLSGKMHPEIDEWDLWLIFSDDVGKAEAILEMYRDGSGHYVKEWRIYHRVFKKNVHYIASRRQ
jgi:hypothetical protein